jgi:hypothetical protein
MWNLEIKRSWTSRTRKSWLTLLWVSMRLWCCRLLVDEVHYYSLCRYLFDSCLLYGFPVFWGSVFYLHVCIDDGLFHFRLELPAFSVAIIYNKNKHNYRSRWCIHANCRSLCYRQLNISTDFPYTLTCTTYW